MSVFDVRDFAPRLGLYSLRVKGSLFTLWCDLYDLHLEAAAFLDFKAMKTPGIIEVAVDEVLQPLPQQVTDRLPSLSSHDPTL